MRPNIKNVQQAYLVKDVTEKSSYWHTKEAILAKDPIGAVRKRLNLHTRGLGKYKVEIIRETKSYIRIGIDTEGRIWSRGKYLYEYVVRELGVAEQGFI